MSHYTIDGDRYDRCTTITGNLPKPWLAAWAAKLVATTAVDELPRLTTIAAANPDEAIRWLKSVPNATRDRAADRGTEIHAIVDAWASGRPLPPIREGHGGAVDAAVAFLADFQPTVEATETTVCDPGLRVAGTFDAQVVIDGRRWVLDWKTGSGVYPEYAAQLAFYAHAPQLVDDGRSRPRDVLPDGAAVVHLQPDGGYRMIPVDVDAGWEMFRAAWTIRRFCSPAVLGDPLVPAAV